MNTVKTIRNCPVKVKFECPKIWDELDKTADEYVRFCSSCNNDVYFCSTDDETVEHAKLGHCIAREMPSADELPVFFLGQVEEQPKETDNQKAAFSWTQREQAINEAINRKNPSKYCSSCGYATSEWSKKCKVCGLEFKDAKVYTPNT